jgi:hypothetical protein
MAAPISHNRSFGLITYDVPFLVFSRLIFPAPCGFRSFPDSVLPFAWDHSHLTGLAHQQDLSR